MGREAWSSCTHGTHESLWHLRQLIPNGDWTRNNQIAQACQGGVFKAVSPERHPLRSLSPVKCSGTAIFSSLLWRVAINQYF